MIVFMYVCVTSTFGVLTTLLAVATFFFSLPYFVYVQQLKVFISISFADHFEEKLWFGHVSLLCKGSCILSTWLLIFLLYVLLTTRSVFVCSAVLRFCTTVILLRTFIAYSLPASCLVNLRTKKTRPYAKEKQRRNNILIQYIWCHFNRFLHAYRPYQEREWF